MKRRQFFRRLALASTAFIVGPTTFKCLPAQRRVREALTPTFTDEDFKMLQRYWRAVQKRMVCYESEFGKIYYLPHQEFLNG